MLCHWRSKFTILKSIYLYNLSRFWTGGFSTYFILASTSILDDRFSLNELWSIECNVHLFFLEERDALRKNKIWLSDLQSDYRVHTDSIIIQLYAWWIMIKVIETTTFYRLSVWNEWRKLHSEELSNLYSLPNIVRVVKSRRMRWAGHVARMAEKRGVHRVLVGKPEGKRPLGRPRRRWEDNIKMDLQEVGGGCGDWMELAQGRDRWRALVSTVMNLWVPKMRGISWLAAEPVSFSRRTLLHGVSK